MKKFLSTFIATACGAGFVPKAPGTAGSLIAIPLCIWSCSLPLALRFAFWLFILVLGTWAATQYGNRTQKSDNQQIVIDEVVGMGITTFFLEPRFSLIWILAFILFRVFDTLKFPPVRQIDRASKGKTGWAGGWGVMFDDVLAGFQGLIIILIVKSMGFA